MNFRQLFEQQKEDLVKRQIEDTSESHSSKSQGKGVINTKKLPQGRGIWRPAVGEHIIEVIPSIYGETHYQKNDPNTLYPFLRLRVHKWIGINKDDFICPKEVWRKPCPICAYKDSQPFGALSKDEYRAVNPSLRDFVLVWVNDDEKETAKGIQLWEVSDFYFGEKMDKLAKKPKGGGILQYYAFTAREGRTLVFEIVQGAKGREIVGLRFDTRVEDIPQEIEDQIFPITDVLNMKPTFEEISEAFNDSPREEPKQSVQEPKQLKEDIPDFNTKCPNGFVFGQDNGRWEECDTCDIELARECAQQ